MRYTYLPLANPTRRVCVCVCCAVCAADMWRLCPALPHPCLANPCPAHCSHHPPPDSGHTCIYIIIIISRSGINPIPPTVIDIHIYVHICISLLQVQMTNVSVPQVRVCMAVRKYAPLHESHTRAHR